MTHSLLALLLAASSMGAAASGVVYDDSNGNGRRDEGEGGLAGVVVSDGTEVAVTGPDGRYRIPPGPGRNVFVITPGDRRAVGPWYRPRQEGADFGLAEAPAPPRWRFAHLSDTHVDGDNVWRLREALALAVGRGAALAAVSGDLVRDALQVGEERARGVFSLYTAEITRAPLPVRSVIGNHDVFGIEREQSHVPETHPAYGKALYEETVGPPYYAFNRGPVHFIALDTIGVDDAWYYGFLDAGELGWIRRELAHVRPGTTVVTIGHIPLRSGALSAHFAPESEGAGRTLLAVRGETSYRHVVRNTRALEEILKPYRWTLALQGHTHMAERLRMWDGGETRFHTAPAVDRQPWAPWPTGIVVYSVDGNAVDDGELVVFNER